MSEVIIERLRRWKNKLIDLSKRNRLLNFKPTKLSTIRIVDEIPSEVYQILAIDEKTMRFLPIGEPEEDDLDEGATKDESRKNVKEEKEVYLPDEFTSYEKASLADKHLDLFLQTNLDKQQLSKNLLRIYSMATSVEEEQGYNALFLALGYLEWYESKDSNYLLRSPILLVPVELSRVSIKNAYTVKFTGDTPVLNPALCHKLSLDFGINLDEVSEDIASIDPQDIFLKLKEKVAAYSNWRIVNDLFLGLFSFTKFIMYKDLETYNEKVVGNEVIQRMCGVGNAPPKDIESICPLTDVEEQTKPEDMFQVLDADSSQQRAILVAKGREHLVIEGPPGTGKSQTIANIIAENLMVDKKILFVSQKMAALDVVKSRLESAGLGDYCLELHSRKANKKRVIEDIAKTMHESKAPDHDNDKELVKLEKHRKDLNDYVKELHKVYEGLCITPYQVMGWLYAHKDAEDLRYLFASPLKLQESVFENHMMLFDQVGQSLDKIGNPKSSNFYGVKRHSFGYSEKIQLHDLYISYQNRLLDIQDALTRLSKNIWANDVNNLQGTEQICSACDLIKKVKLFDLDALRNHRLNTWTDEMEKIICLVEEYNQKVINLSEKLDINIMTKDVRGITERLRHYETQFLHVLNPSYWKDLKVIKRHCTVSWSNVKKELPLLLSDLAECDKLGTEIDASEATAKDYFCSLWKGRNTNGKKLRQKIEDVVGLRKLIVEEVLKKALLDESNWSFLNCERIFEDSANIVRQLEEFKTVVKDIIDVLSFDVKQSLSYSFEEMDLDVFGQKIASIENNIDLIEPWLTYQQQLSNIEEAGLLDFLQVLETNNIERRLFSELYQSQFYRCWIDEVFQQQPILRSFSTQSHEKIWTEFKQLDSMQKDLAKVRVKHKLSGKFDTSWQSGAGSERSIIEREVRKKRAHKPIRKLFKEVPNLILSLKPCLMMSPLSVSQFLPMELFDFDLVIFDEASQVPPEDAIGAIIRAKQLVVAGDSKQLPPTSFFASNILPAEEDVEDFDEYIPDDLDSILDECSASGFPKTMLEWHYRSRHEDLIAFSNNYYYYNRLNTFPASNENDNIGVQFHYIESSPYKGGGVNAFEAETIARKVFEHYKESPKLSLGVGTFNVKQKYAIEDAIESLRKEDNSLEEYFSRDKEEHFFVKNLESIQGDERDVIFISIGYGKDMNGKLSMNFGPINQLGGERRLNVLVTRARHCVRLFSSIRSVDFDLSKTDKEGVHLLCQYLDYAENGVKVLANDLVQGDGYSDSPFEEAVCAFLRKNNYKVKQQVGCSGYKIDMAVLDEENRGKYLLGVECDGASYHSSVTARDRDRLRQQVLEGLGWHIYRIWSTDWFKNREFEEKRLLRYLDDLSSNNLKKLKNDSSSYEVILQQPGNDVSLSLVADYELTEIKYFQKSDFYSQQIATLSKYLYRVVVTESPIHEDEMMRRIVQHWKIKSVGSKIRRILNSVARYCEGQGSIVRKGKFYSIKSTSLVVRKRNVDGVPKKFEYIAPEEIELAVKVVLRKEYGMDEEGLIRQVGKLFGFQRVGDDVFLYVKDAIDRLVNEKNITVNGDEKYQLLDIL